MKHYQVDGMHCSACSSRVESAVSKIPEVTSCSVNLLTNSMTVEGNVSDDVIFSAVKDAGYTASVKGKAKVSSPSKENGLKTRLTLSVILTAILMYFSMGHAMWGFPLPKGINHPIAIGTIQLILALCVILLNRSFFISGFRGVLHRSLNMDTLVAMGSGVSFLYSLVLLILMTDGYIQGFRHPEAHLHNLYFESSAMILTLITVGKLLEERAKGKTTNAIASLMELAPKTALKWENGIETEIPADQLRPGDCFVIKPGSSIPADGIVLQGESAINESALTGESVPVDKSQGDSVSAGTVNLTGRLLCRTTQAGEDTTLAQIIQMVSDAASSKAPIAKVANQVSAIFVPTVIGISVITLLAWIFTGATFGFALARSISVLVISCPCALGLATPVAIMVGNGVGAKHGILFKTAEALEETGKIKVVVLDKTGTITSGNPEVTDLYGANQKELLETAYLLEQNSEHPLGKAIVHYGQAHGLPHQEPESFVIHPGNGLEATLGGSRFYGGNLNFVQMFGSISPEISKMADTYASQGKTPLFFGKDGAILGLISVADTVKETSKSAISQLKEMGLQVMMLTGDNPKTATAIASQVGIDQVKAGVLPHGKQQVISDLMQSNKVMMVGDGINDAPALTSAHIGVALGAGTDIAMDAADVVLMKNSLEDIPATIRLSRATLRNIRQNLFWAFCYNIIGIPLAAGVFIPLWGWELNPMFGAAAMSISSFLVVTNALRLNFSKLYTKTPNRKEVKTMKKTFKVDGMMCPHCEARVVEKLMELPGVSNVVASHTEKSVTLTLTDDVADTLITETIQAQGYQVL